MKVLKNDHFRYLSSAILFGMMLGIGTSETWSQTSARTSDTTNGQNSAAPPQPAINGGGITLSSFQPLISLIQNTLQTDTWQSTGGQGTLVAYPAGVVIDPAGHLRHFRTSGSIGNLNQWNSNPDAISDWRQSSSMRIVSLKMLDRAVGQARDTSSRPARELLELAGLSHIAYVKIDTTNQDILIAGPATEAANGFLLVDLATIISLANSDTKPLGCSIEPTNEGINAAQSFVKKTDSLKGLSRNPDRFVREMESQLGPHRVRVFGLPANCSTAIALVDADEFMKHAGFGSADTAPHVTSYFEFVDKQMKVPEQSLVRWWFCYGDQPIVSHSNTGLFQLPDNCVAVLSEQQQVSRQAVRHASGENDLAADNFANEFTRLLPELRDSNQSCARLCAVFETCLAVQLALEATEQTDLQAWLPNLYAAGVEQAHLSGPKPQTVDGLAAWHRLKSGTTMAVVSGGIEVSPTQLADRQHWQRSETALPTIVWDKALNGSNPEGVWWGD